MSISCQKTKYEICLKQIRESAVGLGTSFAIHVIRLSPCADDTGDLCRLGLVFQRCIALMGGLSQDNLFSNLVTMSSFLSLFPCIPFQLIQTQLNSLRSSAWVCAHVWALRMTWFLTLSSSSMTVLQSMFLDISSWSCKTEVSWVHLCFSQQKDWLGHFPPSVSSFRPLLVFLFHCARPLCGVAVNDI